MLSSKIAHPYSKATPPIGARVTVFLKAPGTRVRGLLAQTSRAGIHLELDSDDEFDPDIVAVLWPHIKTIKPRS